MTWSIDLAGARGVCRTTDTHAAQLDSVVTTAANAFGDAETALTRAPNTTAALAEVAADPFFISLAGMRRMISAVTETTEHVIDLYEIGDLEMAADTQATMSELDR